MSKFSLIGKTAIITGGASGIGKSISKIGVTPDFEVEEEGEEFFINTVTDNQLNYAVKLLNG